MSHRDVQTSISAAPDLRKELRQEIDRALDQLTSRYNQDQSAYPRRTIDSLPSLLEQCRRLSEQHQAEDNEPIRTIHHLACTGGTLFSKCIGTLPNVHLLSEVDPLSSLAPAAKRPGFYPTDLIGLARSGTRPTSDETVIDMFLRSLDALWAHTRSKGQRLVLRDHAHSHFCTDIEPDGRPTLRSIVAERFPVRSVVTVRHPVDVYLSMESQGWLHFTPPTVDEFSIRYMRFLDAYSDVPWVRYEDFLSHPGAAIERISRALSLPLTEVFAEVFDALQLSGDSGRTGATVELKERREMSDNVAQEVASSEHLASLLVRLQYEK